MWSRTQIWKSCRVEGIIHKWYFASSSCHFLQNADFECFILVSSLKVYGQRINLINELRADRHGSPPTVKHTNLSFVQPPGNCFVPNQTTSPDISVVPTWIGRSYPWYGSFKSPSPSEPLPRGWTWDCLLSQASVNWCTTQCLELWARKSRVQISPLILYTPDSVGKVTVFQPETLSSAIWG